MSDQQSQPGFTSTDFANVINVHGYPFQYRTLKAAADASSNRSSPWIFQVSEFPVEVRGRHTRIDYVLQRKRSSFAGPDCVFEVFLVIECKRANPKMKRWCFAKAPYVRRNKSSEYLLTETVSYLKRYNGYKSSLSKDISLTDEACFHVALEVKVKQQTGDESSSSGRGAIEDAATQVNLGVNGLIEYFHHQPPSFTTDARLSFIPVIVTTAQLLAAECDLSEGDIESGQLDSTQIKMVEREWLFYQYPVSPGIRHCMPHAKPEPDSLIDLGKALEANYLRTVAIVQGKYIEKFLSWFGSQFE